MISKVNQHVSVNSSVVELIKGNEYNATIVNMYPNLFGEAPKAGKAEAKVVEVVETIKEVKEELLIETPVAVTVEVVEAEKTEDVEDTVIIETEETEVAEVETPKWNKHKK